MTFLTRYHGLTKANLRVFVRICRMADEKKPITYRELMRRCGMSSPNGIRCHIKSLLAAGLISQEPSAGQHGNPAGTIRPKYRVISFVESPCQDPLPTTGESTRPIS